MGVCVGGRARARAWRVVLFLKGPYLHLAAKETAQCQCICMCVDMHICRHTCMCQACATHHWQALVEVLTCTGSSTLSLGASNDSSRTPKKLSFDRRSKELHFVIDNTNECCGVFLCEPLPRSLRSVEHGDNDGPMGLPDLQRKVQ